MTYDMLGEKALDYLPCRYGSSKLLFRGPKAALAEPYVAFFGGTETYGKFIEKPFVDMVSEDIGITGANFGCMNAGVDVFYYDPFVPEAARDARVSVIQITGAQNLSNRLYSVHPRRNDRFVGPTELMKSLYRDVDFSNFHFNKHLIAHLRDMGSQRFEMVENELRQAWTARMLNLLDRISGKKVLLWFSNHTPDEAAENQESDPMIVDRAMIDALGEHVLETVEVVPSQAAKTSGTDGMVFTQLEEPAARELLSVKAHEEVASALAPVLRAMI